MVEAFARSVELLAIYARRPDLLTLMESGEAAIIHYILELEKKLSVRVPIGDCRTTHAPPSTDPRPKPRSQRRRSGRKSGGQRGHVGRRLEPVAKPSVIVRHEINTCTGCGHDLSAVAVRGIKKTQVFELPQMPLIVTEHQCEAKACPGCAMICKARPPIGAKQPTQYGPRLAGLAVYLHVSHFIPLERTADIIQSITGQRVSDGWITVCQERTSARLDPFITAVTAALCAANTVCCDETGFRFSGRRQWLHVCCTPTLTLMVCHAKRGFEGTSALNILPNYTGIAMHDNWATYFNFIASLHATCNEHHVRELDSVTERDHQPWAAVMKQILYDGLEYKRQYHDKKHDIPPDLIAALTTRYEQCLNDAEAANPEPPAPPTQTGKRGPRKRGKTRSLIDRLRKRQQETLRFLHHQHVPWSNNQAERDIRPMKTQQKITGGFRTKIGATQFCRIRSYLSTAQKNHIHPCDAIASALAGNPWLPQTTNEGGKREAA